MEELPLIHYITSEYASKSYIMKGTNLRFRVCGQARDTQDSDLGGYSFCSVLHSDANANQPHSSRPSHSEL
jgi:hypothetical protein